MASPRDEVVEVGCDGLLGQDAERVCDLAGVAALDGVAVEQDGAGAWGEESGERSELSMINDIGIELYTQHQIGG